MKCMKKSRKVEMDFVASEAIKINRRYSQEIINKPVVEYVMRDNRVVLIMTQGKQIESSK